MGDQRRYTIDEIDAMREAIGELKMLVTSSDKNGKPCSWTGSADQEQIERELRTHMLNGTDPGELVERASKHLGG